MDALTQIVGAVCIQIDEHCVRLTGTNDERQHVFMWQLDVEVEGDPLPINVGLEPHVFHTALARLNKHDEVRLEAYRTHDIETQELVWALRLYDTRGGCWDFEPIDVERVEMDLTVPDLQQNCHLISTLDFKESVEKLSPLRVSNVTIRAQGSSHSIQMCAYGRGITRVENSIEIHGEEPWNNPTDLDNVYLMTSLKSLVRVASSVTSFYVKWHESILFWIFELSSGPFVCMLAPVPPDAISKRPRTKRKLENADTPVPKRTVRERAKNISVKNFEPMLENEDDE